MKKYVFAIIISLFAMVAGAQESQTAYNFLRLPVSAHEAALGGENVTIAKKEIEFSDGIDTFVAEATDQLARNLDKSPIPDGTVVNLQCALSVRNCKAKETGREWKVTNVRIQKIAVV